MKTKVKTFKSSSQKKLSDLIDKLNKLDNLTYPNDPIAFIKEWIAEATPIIRIEWSEVFDDFSNHIAPGGWTNRDMATFVDIVTYGNVQRGSNEHREAWDYDMKEAQNLRQNAQRFLNGLLNSSPNRRKNSAHNDQSVHIHVGDNASIGNLVVSRLIADSFNKIESASISDELRNALQNLATAVNTMTIEMSNESAEQVARDLETLTAEAISKSPRPQWYQLSVDGLKKAAKDVGEIGLPVLKLAAAVLNLLSMKP
jgi:hypothetical protein